MVDRRTTSAAEPFRLPIPRPVPGLLLVVAAHALLSPCGGAAEQPAVEIRLHNDGTELSSASIVDPALPLSVDVSAQQTASVPKRRVTLQATLRSGTTDQVLWAQAKPIDLSSGKDALSIELEDIQLPDRDDVYRFSARLLEPRGLLSFSEPTSYAESVRTLYAVSRRAHFPGQSQWEQHASLLPHDRPWWAPQNLIDPSLLGDGLQLENLQLPTAPDLNLTRRLRLRPEVRQWIGGADGSYGSGLCQPQRWQGNEVYRLEPDAWHVWPLPACDPARPHRVVVRVPRDRAAQLSVAITGSLSSLPVADANGFAPSAHGAALVHEPSTPGVEKGSDASPAVHTVTFWPDQDQHLLIRNLDPRNEVLIESIVVEVDTSVQAADVAPADEPPKETSTGRPVAFYADEEMLRSLGWTAQSSQESGGSDATGEQRGLQVARFLTWHTKHSGFNAAIVALDEETVLTECLLRMCDREGLRLIPALDLRDPGITAADGTGSAPAARSAAPLAMADAPDGKDTASAVAGRVSGAREGRYILEPQVRSRLIQHVARQLDSYRQHPSFGGIALRFDEWSPLSFAQLESGASASATAEFGRDIGREFGSAEEAVEWIAGMGRESWIDWRAQQTTEFLQQVAELAAPAPMLLLVDTSPPPGPSARGVSEELRQRGIDLVQLSAQRGVTVVLKHRWRPTAAFPQRLADFDAALRNRAAAAADSAAGGWIDASNGFDIVRVRTDTLDSAETVVRVPATARGQAADRLPIARLLAAADAPVLVVGGSQFPWGIESANRHVLQTLARLPAGGVDVGSSEGGPCLRAFNSRQGGFLYATNDSLWPHSLSIEFDESPSGPPETVGASDKLQQTLGPGRWEAELPPGCVAAIRLSASPRIRRLAIRPINIEQTASRIRSQLQDLGQRVAAFSSLTTGRPIAGGSFEQHENGKPVGWLAAQHPSDAIRVDHSRASHGEWSVRLENDVPASTQTWLLSKPLEPARAGRMMISLNACTHGDPENPPTVRLSIEARYHDRPKRTSVVLGAPGSGPPLLNDWSTQRFSVGTTDLPLEGLQELRVAVDVQGAGTVWIDDIRRHDFFLLPSARADLQRQIFLTSEGLSAGDLHHASLLFSNPLVEHLQTLPLPEAPPPRAPVDTGEPRPSIADRLRNLLPSALRF